MAYDWPGNVRELENAIESAVALSSDNILTVQDLASVPNGASAVSLPHVNELVPLAEVERRAVLHAFRQTGGDKHAAARLLGIGKTTLYRKLKEYATTPKPTDISRRRRICRGSDRDLADHVAVGCEKDHRRR
jgi:DNA-binding NtrC family response regulator